MIWIEGGAVTLFCDDTFCKEEYKDDKITEAVYLENQARLMGWYCDGLGHRCPQHKPKGTYTE